MAHSARNVKSRVMRFFEGRPLLGWYIAAIATLNLVVNLFRL